MNYDDVTNVVWLAIGVGLAPAWVPVMLLCLFAIGLMELPGWVSRRFA